jgi:hypothetical protein
MAGQIIKRGESTWLAGRVSFCQKSALSLINCAFPYWMWRRQIDTLRLGYGPAIVRDALEELASYKLIQRARRLHVPIHEITADKNNWKKADLAAQILTDQAYSKLDALVVKARRETWEFRLKIANYIITMVSVLTALAAVAARK